MEKKKKKNKQTENIINNDMTTDMGKLTAGKREKVDGRPPNAVHVNNASVVLISIMKIVYRH